MLGKHIRNIENYRKLQEGFKYNEKLRQAQQNFNYADSEHVDAAIMDLNAAMEVEEYKVTRKEVDELRSITGCGLMQTKEALEYAKGDMKIAYEYLRHKAFGTEKPERPI